MDTTRRREYNRCSVVAAVAIGSLICLQQGVSSFSPKPTQSNRCSSGSRTSATAIFAKQKGPRFSQQVHKGGKKKRSSGQDAKNKSKNRSKPAPVVPQPWDSEKSIDDLESSMLKRWGTVLDSPTNGMDLEEEVSGLEFRKSVLDPWSMEPEKKYKKEEYAREFYGKDDEQYEYVSEDGSTVEIVDEDPEQLEKVQEKGPGFFFNPDAKDIVPEPTVPKTRKRKQQFEEEVAETLGEDSESKPQKRAKIPPAQPMLNEAGTPYLLTVEEAVARFQSTIDYDAESIDPVSEQEMMENPLITSDAARPSAGWNDLGITDPTLIENLEAMNCPTPLAVQDKSCPPIMAGSDVLVGTYTGSGKTLAFLVPLVQRLLNERDEDAELSKLGLTIMVIAPGRELASQITSVARELIADTGLTAHLAIGGTTFSRNLEQIRKKRPNILVGTPGRIAELVVGKPGEKSGRLKIGSLKALVMDEFDALLEYKPHREPTQAITQTLRKRLGDSLQSVWCSATASDVADSTKVRDFLRPGYVEAMADQDDMLITKNVDGAKVPRVSRTVMHAVVHVPHRRFSLSTIRRILHTDPVPQQILIFAENARKVDIVVEKLANMGILAAALHGGMGSDKMDRAEVSKALREGYVGVVVATELAARGLDAPLLTHVINMDLPTDASHYAHRAGRCGRGGRPGIVINMTTSIKERKVPLKFADALGIDMHTAEARGGKLILVDPESAEQN